MITAAPGPDHDKREQRHPDQDTFTAYMKYNEDLAKAGVLIASEGLNPQGQGARIGVKDGKRVVLDGPFVESKELVGGFYLIEVPSREEAIAWALRSPVGLGTDDILTIHQMTDGDDIPPELFELIKQVAPTWLASIPRARAAR
ncbi:MAG: YciI family protein [Minicystis sp.]